jgi:hypothetical protein
MNVNTAIWRPPGVYDGVLVTAEHDVQMVDFLFNPPEESPI